MLCVNHYSFSILDPEQAGLQADYSPHSFLATGITNFLQNDGTLEAVRGYAGRGDDTIHP
jgi:hypothetical protein